MLKSSWIPTPLVKPDGRPPLRIVDVRPPSGSRTLYVTTELLLLAVSVMAMLIGPGRRDPDRIARRVREVFERMGGLWIKAGQLIALRIDLLPVALCRELAALQNQALGFPPDVARRIVEEDLGAPIDRYFDVWETEPIAAASIGQVHRARLRDEQVWVAVKVQKPYSKDLFARDLAVIEWIVRLVQALRLYPHMKWHEGLYELRQIMREELDFGYEASSTRRMRKRLRADRIYVPKVFSRYCTPRVLVAEFVEMVLMVDYLRVAREDPLRLEDWRRENGINPRRVARRLVHSFQRQMLELNLYHGDLHPGNIGLLRNGRVALIDFGTTNFTETDYLWKFRTLMRTLATGEFAKSADMCLMLCASLPPIDLGAIHARLVQVLHAWATRTWVKELPYHDKSMDNLTMEVMQVLLGYRCTMEWAWLRLHRASSTLDASLMELSPGIDYRKTTARTFVMAERRRLNRGLTPATARRTLKAATDLTARPARVEEYVTSQTALIRRQAQVFRGVADRVSAAMAALTAIGRLLILAHLAVVVGAAATAWTTGESTWIARLIGGPAGGLAEPDPRPLVAMLAVDAWLWFALARVRRAIGAGRVPLHQKVVAA
jgi:ubiquinone biosynthesis protein